VALEFASIGSGSRGNATLVRVGTTRVLVDCGFSAAETERRLARLGISPQSLDAMLVTHEHSDHIVGVGRLAERWQIPVMASTGTRRAGLGKGLPETTMVFDPDVPFVVGDLEITPLVVPHDAAEPTQFLFTDGVTRLALLTDLGHVTPYLKSRMGTLQGLIIESNHDTRLLADGTYPSALKVRVGGDWGHLNNGQAASFVAGCGTSGLRVLVLAHLSEQNNRPELARSTMAGVLGCDAEEILIADQTLGLAWQIL